MRSRFLVMALALAGAACRDPIVVDPISAFHAPRWQGPVTFVRRTTQGPLDDAVTWTGDVTWIRDDDPDPAPLVAGTAVYRVLSGEMKVTHSLRLSGICSAERETTYRLKPDDGFLMVELRGPYTGYLRAKATFPTKISCANIGSGTLDEDVAAMDLEMKGEVANSVLRGEMPVQTATASTFRGNWNLMWVEF
jgi:hypothetical protein